jgi:hypothetical protein
MHHERGEFWIGNIKGHDEIRGTLPPARQRRVLAWAREHQGELALNWIRCQDGGETPERI